MGFLDTVKGWFNIGGVTVKLTRVEDPFPRDDTAMKGEFTLTTKTNKTVLSTRAEFYSEETIRDGNEEKTERTTLGQFDTSRVLINNEYPFELTAGETRPLNFLITDVDLKGDVGRMAEKQGVIGALGKAASLAGKFSKGQVRYFVEVTADVKGAAFDPSDKVEIRIAPGKS
jgi:hypothetical protein